MSQKLRLAIEQVRENEWSDGEVVTFHPGIVRRLVLLSVSLLNLFFGCFVGVHSLEALPDITNLSSLGDSVEGLAAAMVFLLGSRLFCKSAFISVAIGKRALTVSSIFGQHRLPYINVSSARKVLAIGFPAGGYFMWRKDKPLVILNYDIRRRLVLLEFCFSHADYNKMCNLLNARIMFSARTEDVDGNCKQ
jgi:hypothetical protein